MKKNLLLPHACKIVGWFIMVPLIILWIMAWLDDNLGKLGNWANDFLFEKFMDPYLILIAGSMLMVAFSRERDEDEYVASVRSKYLMLAFYIDFIFIVVTTLTVYEFDYLNIMAIQMFLILFLHIVMFNMAMFVIRRRRSHEE